MVIYLHKNHKRKHYKKDYSKTGYIAYRTNIISHLIDAGKFNLAKKMIDKLLINYPYDKNLILNLVRFYTLNQNYEEAITLLEQLGEEQSILKQTSLHIKLNNEEKVYELYKKHFTDNYSYNTEKIGYNYLFIYLNKKYNQKFQLDIENLTYTERQIYSYSKEKALNHIKNNHYLYSHHDKSMFDPNINIEDLFDRVSEYIKNNNGQMIQNMVDVYDFYYPNCGKNKDNIRYNYFSAYTFIGSKDILTMYPHPETKNRKLINLDELTPKRKIKTKTGLERFNERYNK